LSLKRKTEVTTIYEGKYEQLGTVKKKIIPRKGALFYSQRGILRTLGEKRCKLELFKLIIASFNRNAQANSIAFKTPCNK
jgi:hypothetical protein